MDLTFMPAEAALAVFALRAHNIDLTARNVIPSSRRGWKRRSSVSLDTQKRKIEQAEQRRARRLAKRREIMARVA